MIKIRLKFFYTFTLLTSECSDLVPFAKMTCFLPLRKLCRKTPRRPEIPMSWACGTEYLCQLYRKPLQSRDKCCPHCFLPQGWIEYDHNVGEAVIGSSFLIWNHTDLYWVCWIPPDDSLRPVWWPSPVFSWCGKSKRQVWSLLLFLLILLYGQGQQRLTWAIQEAFHPLGIFWTRVVGDPLNWICISWEGWPGHHQAQLQPL